MTEVEAAYIAGLFDGEGCISYKQYMRKRSHNKKAYPTWQIRLEMAMTDKSVLLWVREVLGVGTVGEKRYKRWRCTHRDAFYVCCAIWPFVHVKMEGVQKIIQHYSERKLKIMNDKVISLEEYKEAMSLE